MRCCRGCTHLCLRERTLPAPAVTENTLLKKTGSILWRIQCWAAVVCTVLAYQAGAILAAVILAGFTALLFWIDFKAGMQEEVEFKPAVSVTGYLAKAFPALLTGLFLIIATQVVMAWVYNRMPSDAPPFLCFLCEK